MFKLTERTNRSRLAITLKSSHPKVDFDWVEIQNLGTDHLTFVAGEKGLGDLVS